MFDSIESFIKSRRVAKQLNLRYTGKVQPNKNEKALMSHIHKWCNARLCVGVDCSGQSFIFCWLCEQVMANTSAVPKNPEPLQLEAPKVVELPPDMTNVITLAEHKKPVNK